MGATISSIFNYGDMEESKNEKYSNIFNSLNKISKTIDDSEEMLSDMEWDYYDAPILEMKELPSEFI